jgi:signal peptidase I
VSDPWANSSPVQDPPNSPPRSDARKGAPLWREAFETLLFALIVFVLLRLVVQNYRVEGPSMEPTLHHGQFLVVNKLAYRLGPLQRGDIIVFRYPSNRKRSFIKRVIGLPGDRLQIVRGQVWVNDQLFDEPYVYAPGRDTLAPTVVEPDRIFVMGDNRNNSSDSRRWGSLAVRDITGKAVLCYWPPQDWGIVEHERPVAGAISGAPSSEVEPK